MQQDQSIMESVLKEFGKITQIPRQSGHEEKISNYLLESIKSMGLRVQQDEHLNIIADKPATPGYEEVDLTVLQAHMDMVCVAADGVEFDPLTDAIQVVREGDYLRAIGTSLGADDGIGVAEILYILQAEFPHGPLRAIITVDEEQGMTGAIGLSKEHLMDAAYVINCDSEDYDVLTVGSAGNIVVNFEKEISWKKPMGEFAYKIVLTGLLGGHSGEEINCGRANAIRLLALTLRKLQAAGVEFELGSFDGGMARNAIAAKAEAVVVSSKDCLDKIKTILQEALDTFQRAYGEIEKTMTLMVDAVAMPANTMPAKDRDGLLGLLCLLHTGVYAMSQAMPGLPETSANIGRAETLADKLKIQVLPRSANDAKLEEFKQIADAAALLSGFSACYGAQSPGWAQKMGGTTLQHLMTDVFFEQNQKEMKVASIHAGLECGWFFQKNPNLDVVSIGVTTSGIHSPEEKIKLSTIAPQVNLIMTVLSRLINA